MKCDFKKIIIHNFKSFADQTFDFSERHGISTIVGVNNDIPGAANAAGKSSLFFALFFVLFGKDAIKTKNKFLKNRYVNGNEFFVQLYMTIDGKTFKIDRGSIGAASYLRLFELTANGDETEITKASILETECALKHILSNLTLDIFLKTVLLTPALGQNFFMMSPKEKTEFLNLLSGTNRIYSINELVNKDINSLNTSIKILDNNLITLSKQLDVLRQKKADFISTQEKMRQEHDAQIEKHNKSIDEKMGELSSSKAEYENLKKSLDELKSKADSMQKSIQEHKMKMVAGSAHVKLLMGNNSQLNSFIEKNAGLIEKLCETCKVNINEYLNMDSTHETINSNNASIEKEKADLAKLKEVVDALSKEFSTCEKELNKFNMDCNDKYATIIRLNKSIESEREIIKTIENNAKSASMTEPFSEMIQSTENELENKKNEKDETGKSRQKLAILKFMTSDDVIHRFVISQFARDINLYIAKYLNVMGVGYTISFDNTMAYTFMTPAGEVSYDTFSSGEKMRLNIAISFAFRKLLFKYMNIDINMLVLDEYIDSALDKLAISGIINLLNEIKTENANSNIYVISHRSEVLQEFGGNRLIIRKTNGISEIIDEND